MKTMTFSQAIESAMAQVMASDDRIILMGEDVQMLRANLFARFGEKRVRNTPVSENAFSGAATGAAMTGLRPVVELMFIDFIGVAMDVLLNQASRIESFSGGNWNVPMVIRAACGGGYGDGGQHEQSLWGLVAHIPGLSVVVPSCPEDAARLMLSAIEKEGPVLFLEHKLLSENWLDLIGGGFRKTVRFDVPEAGARGPVTLPVKPLRMGKASVIRKGDDITIVSLGVGVHRALEAANLLMSKNKISAEVIDLRTVVPLDSAVLSRSVEKTDALVVVDEDYQQFGLSGEIAAVLLEREMQFRYGRVCTGDTIPYARALENETLPNTQRIVNAAWDLLKNT